MLRRTLGEQRNMSKGGTPLASLDMGARSRARHVALSEVAILKKLILLAVLCIIGNSGLSGTAAAAPFA
ncbi:MAG TPA: hypothetical protein VFU95_08610, partial [Telluria sp.]|nr:hypothetical protein [Telluria sp.]